MGFGKDGMGVILAEAPTEPLLTLAANTGLILSGNEIGTALLERFRIIKSEITGSVQDATGAVGDGPLELFMIDGDLTLAEFEEAIETVGPVGPNDTVRAEQASRWYKSFGLLSFTTEQNHAGYMLALGAVVERTIRWTFARAKGWQWVIYNHGTALTTGSTVKLQCKHFGVWVT